MSAPQVFLSRRLQVINSFYYAVTTLKIKVIPFLIHSYGLPNVNTISISSNGQVIKVDLKRAEEKDQLRDDSWLFQGSPC